MTPGAAGPSIVAQSPYACSKKPLVNCIVNDSLVYVTPNVQQVLLQIVNVRRPPLIDSLLDDAPYLVIDRIIVSGRTKAGVDCSRSRAVPRARRVGTVPLYSLTYGAT